MPRDRYSTWQEIVERGSGYASFYKGGADDKVFEELHVARLVLSFCGFPADTPVLPHCDGFDPPDCSATLRDGTRIGVEVTELVDRNLRSDYAKRRKAELNDGITPLDAFQRELCGRDAAFPVKDWNGQSVADKLTSIISAKDRKLVSTKGGPYDRMIIAIFTDETMITPEVLGDAIACVSYIPVNFHEAYVVISYCPKIQDYPVVRLL